jgi:hypothetical protein
VKYLYFLVSVKQGRFKAEGEEGEKRAPRESQKCPRPKAAISCFRRIIATPQI